MGKATIQSYKGEGIYEIEYHFHGRDRIDARIAELEIQIAAIQNQINDLDADDPKANILKLQKSSLEKMIIYYGNFMPDDPVLNVFCVDLSEALEGEVGTVEINGDYSEQNILIRPGYADQAEYDQVRDAQVQPIITSGIATSFLNLAVFPGWQKWKPTIRIGKIVVDSIDYDLHTCTICLQSAFSSQGNLNINQGAEWGDCEADAHSGWDQFCTDNPGHPACTNNDEAGAMQVTPGMYAELDTIQRAVNSEHEYEKDASGRDIGDDWRIMEAGDKGDCEDFALTKMDDLIDAGWPVGNLHLVTCYTETGGYHAVLMITTQNLGNLILDNRYEGIKNQDILSYRWDKYQKAGSSWGLYSTQIEGVEIEYMGCHAGAFADGDLVIVEFQNQDWDQPKVIGFESNPNICGADWYHFAGWAFCHVYDFALDSWSYQTPLPATREWYNMEAVRVLMNAYIMGGDEIAPGAGIPRPVSKICSEFSLETFTHSVIAELLTAKLFFGIFAISNFVFIAGGILQWGESGYSGIDDFDRYNTVSDSWASINNIPSSLYSLACFDISGAGYLLSGHTNQTGDDFTFTGSVSKYNYEGNSFSGLNNISHKRGRFTAMNLGGIGYVMAGMSDEKLEDEDISWPTGLWETRGVDKYNPDTDSWSVTTPYPIPGDADPERIEMWFRSGAGANGFGYQLGEKTTIEYLYRGVCARIASATDTWTDLNFPLTPPYYTAGTDLASIAA